ncbi:MAG: hypothetical protein LBD40_03660, partial [Puniceicoccales bacterium]|nr:hypothetical protein [Puniceicoccales bacterium]
MTKHRYITAWAVLGFSIFLTRTPLSAIQVVVSLSKGNQSASYDPSTLDDGSVNSNGKTWLDLENYDNRFVGEILKDNLRSVSDRVAAAQQCLNIAIPSENLQYAVLRRPVNTRQSVTNMKLKVSVSELQPDDKVYLYVADGKRCQRPMDGMNEFTWEADLPPESDREFFFVIWEHDEQVSAKVYCILPKPRYDPVRRAWLEVQKDIAAVAAAADFRRRQALTSAASAKTRPVPQAPLPPASPGVPPQSPLPLVVGPSPATTRPQASGKTSSPSLLIADYDHSATLPLCDLKGDHWVLLDGEVALQESIVVRNATTSRFISHLAADGKQLHIKRASTNENGVDLFANQVDTALQGRIPLVEKKVKRESAEYQMYQRYMDHVVSDVSWRALLPSHLEGDPWIGSEFSARLGLPLIRMTFRFYILEKGDALQALALPLIAPVLDVIPVAIFWPHSIALTRSYDDNGQRIHVRNFPSINAEGTLLRRNVLPRMMLGNQQALKEACEWFTLPSDLLERLKDGYPHVLYCFLIHSQGIEFNLTLLQKQLSEPESPPVVKSASEPEEYVPSV